MARTDGLAVAAPVYKAAYSGALEEPALARSSCGVKPVTAQVGAGQQMTADVFHGLKLIPKPIDIKQARRAANLRGRLPIPRPGFRPDSAAGQGRRRA
ncbi:hypothetical protein [Chitinimonas koreensis]|uniref:hypothetical protein n=1 Tax=Chitinimonas koreensis TaxID=356302 RepID=UPI00041F21AB|nr:hypothetical protein [Chitinimonas koreensis]QNM98568.1 hypothetical protein H9L41_10290 [Chitinimonas koreensis]